MLVITNHSREVNGSGLAMFHWIIKDGGKIIGTSMRPLSTVENAVRAGREWARGRGIEIGEMAREVPGGLRRISRKIDGQ